MEHPLLLDANKALRAEVLKLLKSGYSMPRSSNIVFVCGGNRDDHMRTRFFAYCEESGSDLEIFKPEFAIENIFAEQRPTPFNLATFEKLVGDLSLAIVLFPEAAGSFAETGYFSAIKSLAAKTILVLDSVHQKGDSFISIGPAKLISERSIFHPVIQTDYKSPDFSAVLQRINDRRRDRKLKYLEFTEFRKLLDLELLYLLHAILNLLRIATIDDLTFVLRALFSGRVSSKRIWQISSILVGAGFWSPTGEYGHYRTSEKKLEIVPRDGFKSVESTLRFEVATLLEDVSPELSKLLEAQNAG